MKRFFVEINSYGKIGKYLVQLCLVKFLFSEKNCEFDSRLLSKVARGAFAADYGTISKVCAGYPAFVRVSVIHPRINLVVYPWRKNQGSRAFQPRILFLDIQTYFAQSQIWSVGADGLRRDYTTLGHRRL